MSGTIPEFFSSKNGVQPVNIGNSRENTVGFFPYLNVAVETTTANLGHPGTPRWAKILPCDFTISNHDFNIFQAAKIRVGVQRMLLSPPDSDGVAPAPCGLGHSWRRRNTQSNPLRSWRLRWDSHGILMDFHGIFMDFEGTQILSLSPFLWS